MKAVIQRVREASVTVDGAVVSSIGQGLLVLLGVANGDTAEKADWMVRKIAPLRIFEDAGGETSSSGLGNGRSPREAR